MEKNRQDFVFFREKKPFPVVEKGEGVYLYDGQGKRYMDASGGPFVVNIGHGVGEVVAAMEQQARKVC
ncbi:MAG TPA: aminotransferase class III-fold pyridoxal phosphate-dependent enzyme, partial [Thermodesulfobacteriota bacterium]|nr:aminotransferase class III-fold pyridoxal phosphate-dependent enzyme [Thermodesulfobacteriota bacterium]